MPVAAKTDICSLGKGEVKLIFWVSAAHPQYRLEVIARRQCRREENGRLAASPAIDQLAGGIHAEEFDPQLPIRSLRDGRIRLGVLLGHAHKTNAIKVELQQFIAIGLGLVEPQPSIRRP